MQALHTAAYRVLAKFIAVAAILTSAGFPVALCAGSVTIKGSNGTTIDFAGVREATAAGVFLTVHEGQDEIFVEWTSFDLADLKTRQPAMHAAYQKLRNGGEPIHLKLGIYENLRTLEAMIDEVNTTANRKVTLKVPPMTGFFDMSGFDNRYDRGDLNSVYSSWQRRSSSYMREYERLLEDFFTLKPDDGNRSTWRYTVNGRPKYVVYTDVRPPRTSVDKPLKAFFHYFADPGSRDNAMLVTYLRAHPDVLKALKGILTAQSENLGNGTVMGEPHELAALKANVDTALNHLVTMEHSTSLSADFQRDFERFVRTWKLADGERRF